MLTRQQREDLLITALEGASNYWYLFHDLDVDLTMMVENEPRCIEIFKAVVDFGVSIPVYDVNDPDDELGSLSEINMDEGEKTMKKESPDDYQEILDGNWDAFNADMWFQYVIMNQITFG